MFSPGFQVLKPTSNKNKQQNLKNKFQEVNKYTN